MKRALLLQLVAAMAWSVFCCGLPAQTELAPTGPDPRWIPHDRNRPRPPVIVPPTPSTQAEAGRPPSDAIVLFDGKDLSAWCAMDGSPSRWVVRDGYMECTPGSGYIRTRRSFGDCQLHIEWAAPAKPSGSGQGRGNSGLFFGLNRYEVQILDSYENETYADGQAAAIYGQYPPLVNASRPPGEWQTYDVVYLAPRFDEQGNLVSPARLTVFHNGVLVQYHVPLTGPTDWINRDPYRAHPEKLPISLQDHGNPVRFRNIWVRELGPPSKPEYLLPTSLLDRYVGTYDQITIAREGDHLTARLGGKTLRLYAESETRFFAKSTDVQIEFRPGPDGQVQELVWSVGEGANVARRKR
ncbi:MAG: DUF1080 domain-containing protein [Limisphaera sp.]|nr:DUF1080 domain-containing protein [Limisphaera sp.]